MKNKLGSKKIISIMMMIVLLLTTSVYAASDSFNTTLTSVSSQAQRGTKITITIGLKDIAVEGGDKGIGSYTGEIKFNPSVFEYVSSAGTDKWDKPFYDDGLITASTCDAEVVNASQSIGTITFLVKEDARLGDTDIVLTNFNGSNSENDVPAKDTTLKLTIIDSNHGNGENNGENNNSGTSNNEVNNGSTNKPSTSTNTKPTASTSKNNTITADKENIKQGILPKTGTIPVMMFVVIGMGTLVAIILFIRMRLLSKKIK